MPDAGADCGFPRRDEGEMPKRTLPSAQDGQGSSQSTNISFEVGVVAASFPDGLIS